METSTKPSKKQKKELTPTQEKVKVALNWTVNVLCIILIIFALIVAIFTIIRATNPDNITRVGDNCYFNVASDSMEPTFTENDVIIAKAYDDGDGSDLKVGQVITFKFVRYYNGVGYDEFNSHRIIAIEKSGSTLLFRTRGDNQEGAWQDAVGTDDGSWDAKKVTAKDIVAVWGDVEEVDGQLVFTSGKMLKGVGGLANFVQDPVEGKTRFFCLIVLPLILLFAIYAFILVRTLIISKLEKDKKVAGETAISLDGMTEEEKQKLIEQLLASKSADSSDTNAVASDGSETSTESNETANDMNGAEQSSLQSNEVAEVTTSSSEE